MKNENKFHGKFTHAHCVKVCFVDKMKKLSPKLLGAFLRTIIVAISPKLLRDHYVFDEKKSHLVSLINYNYELENSPVAGNSLIFGVCIYCSLLTHFNSEYKMFNNYQISFNS